MWALGLFFSLLQLLAYSAVVQRVIQGDSSGSRWRSLSCYNGSSTSCVAKVYWLIGCDVRTTNFPAPVATGQSTHFPTTVIITYNDCSGSGDGKTKIHLSQVSTLQRLRNQYENCTRVWGNLEITFVDKEALEKDKADPDTALQFLETIEEVTGYVLIYANSVTKISLPKLRIIWGDSLYYDAIKQSSNLTFSEPQDGVGLLVYNNPNLIYIDFRELRSIERGKVVTAFNRYLCNWQQSPQPHASTIDFGQLVGKKEVANRLFDFHAANANNFEMCTQTTGLCHPNCTSGHCWGPDADMCQTIYRDNCPSSCESEMCWKAGEEPQLCCHKACSAGCHGPRHDQCYACKSVEQDGACVEQCNGLQKYNHATGMTEPHVDPRYTYNRHCVKQCPENTLIEGENCVTRCKEGYYADTENNDRICRECQGACPKRCELNGELTSEHIDNLINCTIIEGSIILLQHAMTNFPEFDSDGKARNVSALTSADLEKLSHVRIITDFLHVQLGKESPSSLSFLRNLKIIEGRRLSTSRYALLISSNDDLRELGLVSLKQVRKGRVYVGRNPALCYVNSIKWDAIIEQQPEAGGEGMHNIKDNKSPQQCVRQGEVCDEKCNSTMGCWGGSERMCFACASWRIGDKCVESCPESGYYKFYDTRECMPCHSECEMCTGEGPRNCTSCKHVSLAYNNHFECFPECPVTHYNNRSQCQPCDPSCFENGCTGPNNLPGDGGCKMCRYAELSGDSSSVVRCLPAQADSTSEEICSAAGLTNYFRAAPKKQFIALVEQYVCEKCDSVCSQCSGYGNEVNRHNCKCASFELRANRENTMYTEEDRCVHYCPINSFMLKEKQGNVTGVCMSCHQYCDPHGTCTGSMSTECEKCKFAGYRDKDDNKKVECLKECPKHTPHLYAADLFCYREDMLELKKAEKTRHTLMIGAVVAAFVIALLILAVAAFIFRNKYKKEAKYNAPPIPELDPVHPSAEPNMTRLHLITADQLSRSPSRLGSGAFGIVYGGYWWPEGKSGRKVPVAIKVVQEMSGKAQQEMLTEAGIMAGMRHPHLLRLVGVCLTDGLQIITPLRPLGNLLEFVQKHKQKLGSLELMRYCHQIASAMEYLEQNRLVHRDLAGRNVLVKTTFHVEVTDFGLAKMLDYGESEVYVEGKVAVKWLALECLLERRFTHASDVWAFGVTIWEILTLGQSPYPGVQLTHIKDYLKNGNRLSQPDNCSQELYQIMLQCWMEKETARPTFIELADIFSKMLRKPQIYIMDRRHRPQRMESFNQHDQRGLINELLQDTDANFVDPLQYFDDLGTNESSTSRTTPDTPTSPTSPTKPLMPRNHHRLQSTGSSRYQSDPLNRPRPAQMMSEDVPGTSKQQFNLATDDGNYLVPNIRSPTQASAVAYTPVVVRENGETDVVRPGEYYNDNDAQSGALLLKGVDNREYMTGGTTATVSESETTV